jgi:cytochrome c oxidase assembly protein subunit 15
MTWGGGEGNPWPHRLAVLTTGATLVLIVAGGIVTTTGSGMAVPDWPTTFGHNMFLFPWARMVGGVLYEHAHRLIGSGVGLLTVSLAGLLWGLDRRPWVRRLGAVALGAVLVQGTLGGLRVVWAADGLAIVHGAFAQGFVGLLAVLALVTSRGWQAPVDPVSDPDLLDLRRWALATTACLYLQVVLGTLVTHRSLWVHAHILVAVGVSAGVVLLGIRIAPRRQAQPELAGPMAALRVAWLVQLGLGVGAYVARFHASTVPTGPVLALWLPVAHRLVASLMLITGLTLTLRLYRRTWAPGAAAPPILTDRAAA